MRARLAVLVSVFTAFLFTFTFLVGCSDDELLTSGAHEHAVASVQVAPAQAALDVGGSLGLSAAPRCACGSELDVPLTWRSTDPEIATVDGTGVVRAVGPGTTRLIARSGRVEGAATLEVSNAVVATLGPEGGTITSADGGLTLEVPAGALEEATEIRVAQLPDDVFASDGRYVPGTAYECTPDGLELRERARLRIHYDPERLPDGVTQDRLRLQARDRLHDGTGEGEQYRWRQMEQSRVMTQERAVEADVDRFTTFAILARTAEEDVASVSVWASDGLSVVEVGGELELSALARDASGRALDVGFTWTSSDPSVAEVRPHFRRTGSVKGISEGRVTVTATAGGVSGTTTLRVEPPASVGSVVLSPWAAELRIGETVTFDAEIADDTGRKLDRPVTWTSSAPEVAHVNGQGVLTALSDGTAMITATSEGTSGSADVTVLPGRSGRAHQVLVSPSRVTLGQGESIDLDATVLDETGAVLDAAVSWFTSDGAVARVSGSGHVTAVGGGTAIITALAEGATGTALVGVGGPPDDGDGGGDGGGPPDGGHEEGFGNNLSYPVVFAEGIGLTGLDVAEDPGVRPTPEEEIAIDELPFFYAGNAPDYGFYYLQQGENSWRAEWLDGSGVTQSVSVAWGDNLTHHSWNTHSMIRVENVVTAPYVDPLTGFEMTWLYGEGPDEMQGTTGRTVPGLVPTVYSVVPRLTIQKLSGTDATGDSGEPVYTAFDGAIWEGIGQDGPGYYSAEVNVAGKVIYGYNLMIRNVTVPADIHKYGWWRLTFSFDPNATAGGETISRGMSLDACGGAEDPELIYVPVCDTAGQRTYLDIYVESARGGGGGGGGGDDHDGSH